MIYWPEYPPGWTGAPNSTNSTLVSGGKIAYVFQAISAATLTGFMFRTGTGSGSVHCSLQSIDAATGVPSGVLLAERAATLVVASGTRYDITFDATYACTRGQLLAVVVSTVTTTSLTQLLWADGAGLQMPYLTRYNGTTWATVANGWVGHITISGGSGYLPVVGMRPVTGTTFTESWVSTSNPRYRGIRLTAPVAMTIVGAWYWVDNDQDHDVIVCVDTGSGAPAPTSPDLSFTVDKDWFGSTAHDIAVILFSSTKSVNAGDNIYLVVSPSTTTPNLVTAVLPYSNIAAVDDYGSQIVYASYQAAWSTDSTKRTIMGLCIEPVAPVTGGLMRHPGMLGGMVG